MNNIILFKSPDDTNNDKCNQGRLFQLYRELLNPDCDRLFQKARRQSKKFSVHAFENTVLFENVPVGKNMIPKNMKTLCEILDKPAVKNHDVRATAIRLLKRLKFEDRAIMAVSGTWFNLLR